MKGAAWRQNLRRPEATSLIILLLVVVGFSIANDRFLSPLNISNLLAFMPELGIIALGMTLLLTSGEFDLSVGAVFAFCPVTAMLLVQNGGWALEPALLLAFLACIAVGTLNGVLVTKLGISSFLVTLSMLLIVRGLALFLTQGFPLNSWDEESWLRTLLAGQFYIGPIRFYASLIWFAALSLGDLCAQRGAGRQLDHRDRLKSKCRCGTRRACGPS